jgi:HK97 family phage major capsid protein
MNINTELEKALKSITVPTLGNSVLQPEKAKQFVQVLSAASPMLNDARRIDMNAMIRDIDRVGFAGRILSKGTEGVAPADAPNPQFKLNRLIANELVSNIPMSDSALEDNIAKGNLENTLIQLIGDRTGFDLEELFLLGDTTSGDAYLAVTDGWLKKAGNAIVAADYDETKIEDALEKALLAVPQKYMRDRTGFKYYVSLKAENDYRNVLRTKNTSLGDSSQAGFNVVAYKGIDLVVVPNMPVGDILLVQSDNLVYGIHRDIKIEPQRWAAKRSTEFTTSLRADAHFENEEAAVHVKGYIGV